MVLSDFSATTQNSMDMGLDWDIPAFNNYIKKSPAMCLSSIGGLIIRLDYIEF